MQTRDATNHKEKDVHDLPITKINPRLYLGATAKLWQAADGEWRYRTFGRCQRSIEGRASTLALALADVRRFA